MDINFESFKIDIARFERAWNKAKKDKDSSKQSAVLLAFSLTLKKSQTEVQNMAEMMSKCATNDILDEIKKA